MKANNDPRWMQLALSLGARGLGQVAPNPAVGCVIVRDGRVLGRGWTQPTGRPHAETVALKQAGNAHGATAYVTLEPCAHQGKTPPCANALIEAGISRVVCPLADPDSRVSGKGFEMLRAAGTTVDIGLMASEARAANAGFLLTKTHNRPLLTLKLALSLDGRIATHTGESRWITGPQARARVQHMRATHDAVMIGRATAEADNPMLAIDGFGPTPPNPIRVVLDSGLSLSPTSRLAQSARHIPLWICHSHGTPEQQKIWEDLGAKLIKVDATDNGLNLPDMMQKLANNGLTRILSEGGGQVAASLIKAQLVDHLEVFHAGLTLGANGTAGIGALAFNHLADFPRFTLQSTTQLGADTLSSYIP